ncbi:MAG: hypothetical protein K2G37_02065 [Clostridia bacterium]|nr:hypothetical protein [Clostridia bacterium]MDE7329297.1 hypothetical protein [Clostridia bacterium]
MKKKVLACVVVVVLILSIICCAACSNETSFEKVVKCAKDLQSTMSKLDNFESFVIDDACGYKKGYEEYIFTVFIYIPFTTTDTNGDYWKDVAFYVGGELIGFYTDYDDGSYKELDDEDQLLYLYASLIFLEESASETFSKDDVMKAIAPATEDTDSGAQE